MNADERRYKHEQTTRQIIGVFFDVYNELGYGFLDSVYCEAMTIALRYEGLQCSRGWIAPQLWPEAPSPTACFLESS